MLPELMVWVAGADGCKRGWFRAARETQTGELRFDTFAHASELLRAAPSPRVLGLDIPIGLPASGRRACDEAARAVLGARRASVFDAPIRPALAAASREEASRITARCDGGRKVSAQAFGIYRKVHEVDLLLVTSGEARARIREVHPEVCFWAWNGEQAMRASKRTPAGLRQRKALAEKWLGAGTLTRARKCAGAGVADDDILDAIAALWTATRIAEGRARTLPERPPVDATGLRMEIVY
jgi:predicted RNase H-like nuclease